MTYSYEEVLAASTEYFDGDELAGKIWVDKYSLKNSDGEFLEKTPEDMHWRIAKEFARIEKKKYSNPLTKEEIFDYLDRFKYILPQGSPMFGIGNKYSITSLSNCYVLDGPNFDSYSDILNVDEQLVNISKRRGGCGICLDVLRPAGTPTNNAAKTTTGIVSWMERYSNSLREVGQNNRRGAGMLTLSIHHPDILEFATIKNDNTKVTGANISVCLTDEFREALKNNEEYELRWPVNSKKPKISKMVSAKEVWDTIIHSAWMRAEPGILNWDAVLKGPADCYETFRSVATNPCCFAAERDVWVITNNGYKEIQTVTADDLVWVPSKRKFSANSGYFSVGEHQLYEITYDNDLIHGRSSLLVTYNHKFPVIDAQKDWQELVCEAQDIEPGMLLFVNNVDPITGIYTDKDESTSVRVLSVEKKHIGEAGCIEVYDGHELSANGIRSFQSEIPLSKLDSCRLIAINLLSYVENPFTDDSFFNYDKLYEHTRVAQRLMDDLVDLESEKIDAIIAKIDSDPEPEELKAGERNMWIKIKKYNDEGRRTGLGITALGDTLAALGQKYCSDESIGTVGEIYKTLKLGAYRSSVDMAKDLGHFDEWDHEKEKKNAYLLQIKKEDLELYNDMKQYGRRNVACLTTAPTGSTSLLTQTSSGIEPVFMLSYVRRTKINPGQSNARVDFVDQNGDSWQEFTVYHPTVKKWMEVTGETDITKSPWYGACAQDIDPIKRVELQAAAGQHVDHAISSTINLAENTSEQIISDIYNYAFDLGIKGITVYRDNCRTGVLVSSNPTPTESYTKRPTDLPGDLHHINVKGDPYFVLIGLLNGKPYELWAGRNGFIDPALNKATIHKMKRPKCYRAEFEDGSVLQPITATCSDNEEALTRMISMSLRHGAELQYVVDQLQKTQGPMTSLAKAIARALKGYVGEGVTSSQTCECGSKLTYESGCCICKTCGFSKCN